MVILLDINWLRFSHVEYLWQNVFRVPLKITLF
jgi:hypothetical protein